MVRRKPRWLGLRDEGTATPARLPPMIRIGINALYLIPGGVGGTEVYLRELLAALSRVDAENEYFVFTNLETGGDLTPHRPNFHWTPQAIHARSRPMRILWEQTILPVECSRYRIDVLFNPGFTAPIFALCRCVTVFHDLQHLRHPEHFRWFDLPPWRFLLWAAAYRSQRLVAVSAATAGDLVRFYHIPRERIAVVHHGVDAALLTLEREPQPFILCVSTLHPHKNLERLIRAYSRRRRDCRLILAGMRGFQTEVIERLIAELGLAESVELTGWISRERLFDLYRHAWACVQPSTFEGFGMPVLEAMAAGVPLACSNIPPHGEVAADTALLFDPLDEDAIDDALNRIVSDESLRLALSNKGRLRARDFTWERTAQETLDVIRGA